MSIREKIQSTWDGFCIEFPTERHCVEKLWNLLPPNLRNCPGCGSDQLIGAEWDRVRLCSKCWRKFHITRATMFRGFSDLRPWFAAIYFRERRVQINPSQLSALLGVPYESVRKILRRLVAETSTKRQSTKQSLQFFLPGNERQVCSEPAEMIAAAETSEPISIGLDDEQATILRALDTETATHFDVLFQLTGLPAGELSAVLTILELNGLIKPTGGDRYLRVIAESRCRATNRK